MCKFIQYGCVSVNQVHSHNNGCFLSDSGSVGATKVYLCVAVQECSHECVSVHTHTHTHTHNYYTKHAH